MKSLYDADTFEEVSTRLTKLSADSVPLWGGMTVEQMLAHCSEVQEVTNGEKPLRNTNRLVKLFKGFVRRGVLSKKPYRQGVPTHPSYRMESGEFDFEEQVDRLRGALDRFRQTPEEEAAIHPLLGPMTRQERGWATFKHLDHHLRQFGV